MPEWELTPEVYRQEQASRRGRTGRRAGRSGVQSELTPPNGADRARVEVLAARDDRA